MSYVTQDRHGACTTTYASIKNTESVGTGKTWWPDFGPSIRDHSFQEKFAPHHHIFEKVVKPFNHGRARAPPPPERQPTQFRNPAPARQAMLMQDQPTHERLLAAKEVTARQCSLRMLEVRQRQVDSWLEDVPMRMKAVGSSSKAASLRSRSEPSLSAGAAASVSRDVYEKLGFLVGRSKGSIADGMSGAESSKRRHNPLGMQALMFGGNVQGPAACPPSLKARKPTKQWQTCPESSFVFDPRTSLPVPRGGWNSQPPSSWPEAPSATSSKREWSAPVTFDGRPKGSMGAIEYPQSPGSYERGVTCGSAGSTVRKIPYGEVREPGQERQGLGAQALQSTGSFSGFGGAGLTAAASPTAVAQ